MYNFLENLIDQHIFYTFIFSLICLLFFIYTFKKKLSLSSFFPIFIFIPFFLIIALRNILKYLPGEKIGGIDGWLSFLGGYLGAFITLGGIWWQLKHSDNTRNNELKTKEIQKNKEINEKQTSSLLAALHLIQNSSDTFSQISEVYLKNFIYHSAKTSLKSEYFSYNKVNVVQ